MSKARDILSLCESNQDLIVVDVQPMYRKSIWFNMEEFTEYVGSCNKVLVLFNGVYTVGTDSEEDVRFWYYEHGLDENTNLTLIDKGYGFFRAWMDLGCSRDTIIKTIQFMNNLNVHDSRMADQEELMMVVGDEWESWMENDPLIVPQEVDVNLLRKFDGASVCGGANNECLEEVLILMDAFNIGYDLERRFIYG